MPTKWSTKWTEVFQDETGGISCARCLLIWWTLFDSSYLVFGTDRSAAVWAFLSTIYGAHVMWAAGPRISEYLSPFLSRATEAVAKALARRDPKAGIEETR